MAEASPDTEKISEFLSRELANGPVSVKDLQAKAAAVGLVTEGGRPIWKSKPWRRVSERLEVRHFQEGREWFWKLPLAKNIRVPAASSQSPAAQRSDAREFAEVAPAMPSVAQADLVAARRKFAEETMRRMPELIREGTASANESVARYLRSGRLEDLFPAEN
jgi:hypothetical protein